MSAKAKPSARTHSKFARTNCSSVLPCHPVGSRLVSCSAPLFKWLREVTTRGLLAVLPSVRWLPIWMPEMGTRFSRIPRMSSNFQNTAGNAPKRKCQRCGGNVSRKFVRVFAIDDEIGVFACPNCAKREEIRAGACSPPTPRGGERR